MRKFRIILQSLIAALLIVYVAIVFALDNSRVQGVIAQQISTQLEEVIGSQITIESVNIGLLNSVELHNVTLYDQQHKPLLESSLVYGKFRLLPLIKGHIFLRNISILDGNIHLYKQDAKSAANYQFLVDLIKSDKEPRKPINLTINSLLLRRCALTYDEYDYPSTPDGRFSPHHIHMDDIDANLSLKHLTDDAVNLRVRQLSFREQSGLRLNQLRLHLIADRTHASINDFVLELPASHIRQKNIEAYYDLKAKESILEHFRLNAKFDDILLSSNDLTPLVPTIAKIDETLHISTQANIRGENMRLDNLYVSNEQQSFSLSSDVQLGIHPSSISANLQNLVCEAGQPLIEKYTHLLPNQSYATSLIALGTTVLRGDIDVFVPTLKKASAQDADSTLGETSQFVAPGKRIQAIVDNATGSFKGSLSAAFGQLTADASYRQHRLNIALASNDINPSLIVPRPPVPSHIDFEAKAICDVNYQPYASTRNGSFYIQHADADVNINTLTVDNLTLHNLGATAKYKNGNVAVNLTANDPAIMANAEILANLDVEQIFAKLPSNIAVYIDAQRINPASLHLTNKYGNGELSFRLKADAQSLELNNLQANVHITDFVLSGDNNNLVPYHLKQLIASAEPTSRGNHIRMRSDFADLDYSGSIQPDSLKSMLDNFYRKIENGMYVDGASDTDTLKGVQNSSDRYNFALVVKDVSFINRMLNIDASQQGTIQVQATAMQDGSYMTLSAYAPELAFGKMSVSNLSIFAHSNNGAFNLLGKVSKKMKNGEFQAEMTAVNKNGKIVTDIEWDEIKSHAFYGKVSAASHIALPHAKTMSNESSPTSSGTRIYADTVSQFAITTEFTPSVISLGDSLWNVSDGLIQYKDKRIVINNVGISHADQRLTINGIYDRMSQDTIVVNLNKIDLDYALAFAHLNVVDFGGHATGTIYVRQLPNGNPWAKAHVLVPDFTFNHAPFGIADVTLGWNHENSDINIQGDIQEPGIGYTRVRGYVDPINRDLDLRTESKNTQLGFLNKYTAGIFEDISGRATGNCRIYGPFKEIEFSGKEIATCQATIPVTGVTYTVSDAVVNVLPDAFQFSNATIRDNFVGIGHVEGTLRHEHLQNMTYDFLLNGNNLRMYEKPRELDMPFYATATGSGNVRITGVPGKMNADIRITTTPGSELTYILDSPDADVSQLLSLRDATITEEQTEEEAKAKTTTAPEVPETEFNLYFEVDVEDQSRLNLITDDKSGDVITVYGDGPIQAIYHNRSGFQMFGTYHIQRGTYGLNIPSLAQRKKFDILSGGRVQFSGDPTEADVNVHAQYVVNSASLADLNIGTGFANNTTRVNCVVDIFGEVANMQFNLDFELPNCSEDEQQMVRHLIASEEDRTRQVLYLLGVGRFYAYNFTSNELGQSQSVLMMNSLLSTTLSSQLNNIISNAVGNNNWTFGTNISTGQLGWNDMEVEGLVSSRLLNNRLLINGNFGYSERQAATTNFVGDFDVQYLITPKGNVSVRAYSETNDRYFTKSTLTTQGVGIQLKRDFTHFISLFRKNKTKNNRKK